MSPQLGDNYLDVTAGFGGHAQAIIDIAKSKAVLVDRDMQAFDYLNKKFSHNKKVKIIHSDFLTVSKKLYKAEEKFNCILADLGISSVQIDDKSRGFSFVSNTLDMRMDKNQETSAIKVINEYEEEELKGIFIEYGEVSPNKGSFLARCIIEARPLNSATELLQIVKRVFPTSIKRIEAQIFQAIRIEVNDELGQLKQALPVWEELLVRGGRLAVITFHSLEDRIVKEYFAHNSKYTYDSTLQLINKKPITPSKNELVSNPRSRSAKLRVVVKK